MISQSLAMSRIEQLPVEILQDISDHLAFFDKNSVSLASRQCHSLMVPLKCQDLGSGALFTCLITRDQASLPSRPLSSADVGRVINELSQRFDAYYK